MYGGPALSSIFKEVILNSNLILKTKFIFKCLLFLFSIVNLNEFLFQK